MMNAAYYRAWRRAHPEYRERQNRLRNARRRLNGRENRATEYRNRASRAIPPIPSLHLGHALFEEARRIVGERTTSLRNLYDPLHDDLLSVATLALIEGQDAGEQVRRYRSAELRWGRVTASLLGDMAA